MGHVRVIEAPHLHDTNTAAKAAKHAAGHIHVGMLLCTKPGSNLLQVTCSNTGQNMAGRNIRNDTKHESTHCGHGSSRSLKKLVVSTRAVWCACGPCWTNALLIDVWGPAEGRSLRQGSGSASKHAAMLKLLAFFWHFAEAGFEQLSADLWEGRIKCLL